MGPLLGLLIGIVLTPQALSLLWDPQIPSVPWTHLIIMALPNSFSRLNPRILMDMEFLLQSVVSWVEHKLWTMPKFFIIKAVCTTRDLSYSCRTWPLGWSFLPSKMLRNHQTPKPKPRIPKKHQEGCKNRFLYSKLIFQCPALCIHANPVSLSLHLYSGSASCFHNTINIFLYCLQFYLFFIV